MKFPESLTQLISKKKDTIEYYFSLVLASDGVSASTWSLGADNELSSSHAAHVFLPDDTWDERMKAADAILSKIEDAVHADTPITKTVFGVPPSYLTRDGNITSDVRSHLKKLSTMLELTPVGFVPLTQALAFLLKKKEGVPTSVILVHCTKDVMTVSLYRVGVCVREKACVIKESAAYTLEEFFTEGEDSDVLPSRILLYGEDMHALESVRGSLLKHQWTTRANFLHFPKVEIISSEEVLHAVSLAGSFELASTLGEDVVVEGETSTIVAQPSREEHEKQEENVDASFDETKENEEELNEEERETDQSMYVSNQDDEDVENVEVVGAESVGFGSQEMGEDHIPSQPRKVFTHKFAFAFPAFSVTDVMGRIKRFFSGYAFKFKGATGIMVALGMILVFGLLYYFIPRATVTVLVMPITLSESATLTVDPTATIVDSASKIIPGMTQELALSAQKTISVTGKKKVGDPARGTVTFYNKITSERILKKGTILTAKGISFSLDEETKIASASESISGDSITFGKKDASITSVDIGSEGNLAKSTEFVIKDISTSSLSARNDAPFAGGVSKEVTVVSRADYDSALKALTDEIVSKAKGQLLNEAGGNRLIEQTIKTKVSQKQFDKELDQEAKELSANVTASVSGIVMRDDDVKSLLLSLINPKVPSGYSLKDGKTDVTVGAVQIKKDGKIMVSATLSATALPFVDVIALQRNLKGKTVSDASQMLKGISGVSGAEFRFVLSLSEKRLPINKANITIGIAIQ